MAKEIKKVVLAYSGGLDTSIIIPWLKENYNNCEVIAVSGDVGQGTELDGLEEKAIKTGASKLYIEDLTEEFITDYVYPTVQAGAVYENRYLLGTSFARPIIAKRIAGKQMFNTKALVGFIIGILIINAFSVWFIDFFWIRLIVGISFLMINLFIAWKYIYPVVKNSKTVKAPKENN